MLQVQQVTFSLNGKPPYFNLAISRVSTNAEHEYLSLFAGRMQPQLDDNRNSKQLNSYHFYVIPFYIAHY